MGFGSAALFSWAAWRLAEPPRCLWLTLALIYALMAAEVLFGARFCLQVYLKNAFLSFGIYEDRRDAQSAIIGITIAVALIFIARVIIASKHLPRNTGLALSIMWFTIFLFGVETVSAHWLDQVFYHQVGPILLIGWVWAFCGIAGTWAAAMRLRK